jgi:thioesterase domain-containing protein/acyl carrier protein
LPNGKVDGAALASLAARRPEGEREFEAPRTPAEEALSKVWAGVLGLERVGVNEDFFELGGHSLLAVRLMSEVEKRCGVRLPLAALFGAGTVAGLAAELERATPAAATSPLVPVGQGAAPPALIFAHDVSGQVLSYYPLAAHLKDRHPTYALQARPDEEGAAAPSSLVETAADYAREILKAQPRGPYFLAGHSSGAAFAFETAAQLESLGARVAGLLVFDAVGPRPDLPLFEFPEDEADLLVYALRTLAVFFGREIRLERAELENLQPDARFALALERLREQNVLPPETTEAQMASMFRTYQSNIRRLRGYRPGTISAPVFLWSSKDRPRVEGEARDRGWSALTKGGVTAFEAEGDHVSMMKEPGASALAAQILSVVGRTSPE